MKQLFIFLMCIISSKGQVLQIRLPKEVYNYRELDKESTFCTSVDVNELIYIYQFEPILNHEVNHITVVAVSPIKEDNLKNSNKENNGFLKCSNLVTNSSDLWQSASNIKGQKVETIYVTSKYGQILKLPPNVGFEIGKLKTKLYIQVHFAPMKSRNFDEIGVDIHYSTKELPLKAGIMSLHAAG